MGLDTTHECWHGAYSAFHRWRLKLAEVAGYKIGEIKNSDGSIARDMVIIDWGRITHDNIMGKWKKTPDDPLMILIAHSDCDGKIYPRHAKALAKRLEELLVLLPKDDDIGHIGNWRSKTKYFISGLYAAAKEKKPVEFR